MRRLSKKRLSALAALLGMLLLQACGQNSAAEGRGKPLLRWRKLRLKRACWETHKRLRLRRRRLKRRKLQLHSRPWLRPCRLLAVPRPAVSPPEGTSGRRGGKPGRRINRSRSRPAERQAWSDSDGCHCPRNTEAGSYAFFGCSCYAKASRTDRNFCCRQGCYIADARPWSAGC